MLAILDKSRNLRFEQAIRSVQAYCERNSIGCRLVGQDELPTLADRGFKALYCVVSHDLAQLKDLQPGVKLILDHDIVDPQVRFKNDEVLVGRSYAFRRAFGGKTCYTPELQVPYTHRSVLPENWEATAGARDTMIFDLHRWLAIDAQFVFAALMQEVGRRHNVLSDILGRRLNIYLTGMIRPELYQATTECFQFLNQLYHMPDVNKAPLAAGCTSKWMALFGQAISTSSADQPLKLGFPERNNLDVFLKNVIPPIADRNEFINLFGRAVCFITDHGDIADQDVSTCLALGIPILTVPRSPWRRSTGVGTTLEHPLRMIDPEFAAALAEAAKAEQDFADGIEHLLSKGALPPLSLALFERLFDRVWGMLIDWCRDGTTDRALGEAIDASPRWNFGMH